MSLINYRRLRRWLSALHSDCAASRQTRTEPEKYTQNTAKQFTVSSRKITRFLPRRPSFPGIYPKRKHYSRGSNTWKVDSMQQVSDRLIILHIDCILVFVIYSFLLVFSLCITRWWIKVAQYRANTLLVINPTNSLTVLHNLSPKHNREPRRRISLHLRFNHQASSRC